MSAINIEWLWDSYDCDQAGCSGGYCEGARVTIDGKVALELIPHAHCYGGDSWSESEVYKLILSHLGHTIEDDYE